MSDIDYTYKALAESSQKVGAGVMGNTLSEQANNMLNARISDTRVASDICQAIKALDPALGAEFWSIYSGHRNGSGVDPSRQTTLVDALKRLEPKKTAAPLVNVMDPPAVEPEESSDAYARLYQIAKADVPA